MQNPPEVQHNFALPIRDLESDLVRLTPFVVSLTLINKHISL